jgi:thiamine pyrophosphate-dependent acetolactate synthase large subunit-like protein
MQFFFFIFNNGQLGMCRREEYKMDGRDNTALL